MVTSQSICHAREQGDGEEVCEADAGRPQALSPCPHLLLLMLLLLLLLLLSCFLAAATV
jgi:hypothetical protein